MTTPPCRTCNVLERPAPARVPAGKSRRSGRVCAVGRAPGEEGQRRHLPGGQGEQPFKWRLERGRDPLPRPREDAPKPRRDGGIRNAEASVTCAFFPPLQTEQSSCVQWPLRKASHFLRRYRAAQAVFPFPRWLPLPEPRGGRSLCCAGRSRQSRVSAFCRAGFWSALPGSGLGPEAWPEGRTNARSLCSQDAARVGPRGQDVARSSAGAAAL